MGRGRRGARRDLAKEPQRVLLRAGDVGFGVGKGGGADEGGGWPAGGAVGRSDFVQADGRNSAAGLFVQAGFPLAPYVASQSRIRSQEILGQPLKSDSWLSWAIKLWLSWPTKLTAVVQGLANAGRLNGAALGNIFWQVTSTEHILSVAKEVRPKKRAVPDTCVIVAITVAMEAKHRFMYGLPWTAAEPEHLLERCRKSGIWTPENGASITGVLAKVRSLHGVPIVTANADLNGDPARCPRLPLTSWQKHEATGLCPELVAELLDRGPCVARIYPSHYDSGEEVVFHAVVCFGYRRHAVHCFGHRLCRDQMQVLVLDNDDETGPWRWIHLARIDTIYTLEVGRLDREIVHLQVHAASPQGRARV
ncbi:hypothetical protein ACP70R_050202 [Stipagrostis hirtigluma subsp. patula]